MSWYGTAASTVLAKTRSPATICEGFISWTARRAVLANLYKHVEKNLAGDHKSKVILLRTFNIIIYTGPWYQRRPLWKAILCLQSLSGYCTWEKIFGMLIQLLLICPLWKVRLPFIDIGYQSVFSPPVGYPCLWVSTRRWKNYGK